MKMASMFGTFPAHRSLAWRRHFLKLSTFAAVLPWTSVAAAAKSTASEWFIGAWRSDVERSMANFTYGGRRPTPAQLQRIAALFGKMVHTITPEHFTATQEGSGAVTSRVWSYRVVGESANTVSLDFSGEADIPPMTLYRADDRHYFTRNADHNFEYFERVG